jgi:hypothetical protein
MLTNNTKLLTILLLVTCVVTAASAIVEHQLAHAKFCDPSGCKGTKGYYTREGHHHCFKGTKGCEESDYAK